MLVSHLIEELKKCDQDSVVTIEFEDGGWSNIGELKRNKYNYAAITIDSTSPFSDGG